jgi:membrane associated rhomboid family serine protease
MPEPGAKLKSRERRLPRYNRCRDRSGEGALLIVPLHRSLNRANFPFMTAALILINCVVFFCLQSDDERVQQQAFDYYRQAAMERIEFPAFSDWLRTHSQDPRRIQLMQRAPDELKLQLLQSDEKFLAALHEGQIIAPTREGYTQWREQRAEFERLWASGFTQSHELRFSEFVPARLFAAMFLHGGFGHLLGNMVFLAILGLLVEGALGPWLFLAVYLLGGFGANLLSLAWRWGEHGAALGASGAIAALMGAYCLLWGMRKVRVFYWFFIVFDYVRVPALVLLPFWFGWEAFNLLFNHGAHVGFDAHAGGILCGALLAFAIRRVGWERHEFLAADERAEQRDENAIRLQQALQHLGKLEIPAARDLLQKIDQAEPGQLRVIVALYRCARYGGKPLELDAAAQRVLAFDARSGDDIREVKAVYDDYAKACAGKPRLPSESLLRLAKSMLRIDLDAAAEGILRTLAARSSPPAGLELAWFELVRRAAENTPPWRSRLEYILQQFPQSDAAKKARFLLDQA